MKRIQCIIVDDEPLARELIKTYVNHLPNWEMIKMCSNTAEAYEALYQNEIDVIFLDIQMPSVTGVEFLRTLRNPPYVIFTTAHAHHALDAFDLDAVDYLLKPITEKRFLQSIDKLNALMKTDAENAGKEPDAVFLKQDGKLVKVVFEDILYVEALRDFSKLFLKGDNMLLGTHLKQMDYLLPPSKFVRVHRSYIVAIDAITALQGNTVEIGKHVIPVGATFKAELLKRLKLNQ